MLLWRILKNKQNEQKTPTEKYTSYSEVIFFKAWSQPHQNKAKFIPPFRNRILKNPPTPVLLTE